jgi:hypothetical protein
VSNWSDIRAEAHAVDDGFGMWLLDKDMEPVGDLRGRSSLSFSDSASGVDVLTFTLPADHPAVGLLLPVSELDADDPELTWRRLIDESMFVLIEAEDGARTRMVWRVHRVTLSTQGRQSGWVHRTLTVECKHLRRYVEKIACRADPGAPVIAQLKYRDFRAGDSLRTLKEYLLVNLMRDFQPRAITGWDYWNVARWQNVIPDLWPAIVSPVHESTTTAYTVLDARFDMAADLLAETLDAAGLMLTVDLWLEGDPQPAPDHVTLTRPTLWIDIKARQFDTSTTGTAVDFLRGLVRTFDKENNVPRVGLGDTPATAAGLLPWVVWRPEDMAGATADFVVVKSEDWHTTVGGKSPEILNKMIAGGSKALFQGLAAGLAAAFPPFAPLIVAAGVFLGEAIGASLQDKLFAWQEFSDSVRKEAHGRFAYRDQVGSGDAWTLSAWQQGFQMLRNGAGKAAVEFDGGAALAYQWGRDFRAGDQQGVVLDGVVFATYVSEVNVSWSPEKGWRQSIKLGDPTARESVAALQQRSARAIKNRVDRLLSFVQ